MWARNAPKPTRRSRQKMGSISAASAGWPAVRYGWLLIRMSPGARFSRPPISSIVRAMQSSSEPTKIGRPGASATRFSLSS